MGRGEGISWWRAMKLFCHGDALGELLDAALAEVDVAEFEQLADLIGRGVLGDGDDEDVIARATGPLGGVGNALHEFFIGGGEFLCWRHP